MIGEKIREARKRKKCTQIELAERAGIAVNSLRLYEAEKRTPNITVMEKIADALGMTLFDFVDQDMGYTTPYVTEILSSNDEADKRLAYEISRELLQDDLDYEIDLKLNEAEKQKRKIIAGVESKGIELALVRILRELDKMDQCKVYEYAKIILYLRRNQEMLSEARKELKEQTKPGDQE